jgi:molybdopterin/thiamine biosynthesis adenylyltransferase/rhodanese-related sulfurtransferase
MNTPDQDSLEISAAEAAAAACPEQPLFDIREPGERQSGSPLGAQTASPEEILERARRGELAAGQTVFLICQEGIRSMTLVRELRARGVTGALSVAGGFQAWLALGLPSVTPDELNDHQARRYARHLVLPQVGPKGQKKLLESRVLLAGLGGLNSPAAMYLAAAGVGTLGLVDFDRVERSNLQRQVLHGENTLGSQKTASARARLQELNPEVETVVIEQRIGDDNAGELVRGWDLVIDGTDNFPARYALNRACIGVSIPLVYGSVSRFQGQVSVFWPAGTDPSGPCLACLVSQAPGARDAPRCAEAGVLGAVPGIVGTLQATEALKLLLGAGEALLGRLLLIDALGMDFRVMKIPRAPNCTECGAGVRQV